MKQIYQLDSLKMLRAYHPLACFGVLLPAFRVSHTQWPSPDNAYRANHTCSLWLWDWCFPHPEFQLEPLTFLFHSLTFIYPSYVFLLIFGKPFIHPSTFLGSFFCPHLALHTTLQYCKLLFSFQSLYRKACFPKYWFSSSSPLFIPSMRHLQIHSHL